MVFSSISFLYFFLPFVLIFYFIIPNKYKNIILLIFSLLFYFYGEPRFILILLFSCIFNYYFGKILDKATRHRKLLLITNLIVNFSLLFYFKYFNFFLDNINLLFKTNINFANIIMPIGISFFTFQSTSYIIDIYNKKIKSAKNIIIFSTYLALFPQLIAGPIVRYETIEEELKNRKTNYSLFANGVKRFVIGLSKKVLIANILGECSKAILTISNQTILSHWIRAISDTLQIYFDFSGYSDMAIGLGLMFGFKFLENFNYPFISSSITEFWRRWHISLSSWFKDYLYIPLGGNKVKKSRHYLNILIVWMTTGLWHGASWNFVLWGLYFAILLIIEKLFLLNFLKKYKFIGHFYTMFLIIISFVIFNANDLTTILTSVKSMLGFNNLSFTNIEIIYYLKNYILIILIAIVLSTPLIKNTINKLKNINKIKIFVNILEPIFYIALLIISTAFIIDESFNPFLYFRF